MERKNPKTSLDAYESMTTEILSTHHKQIIEALACLGKATYEDIASHLRWDDKNRASRRLAELERSQIVYKPGDKKPTKSNRQAYVYMLCKNNKYTQGSFF